MSYTVDDFDYYEKLDARECRFDGDAADASGCAAHSMPQRDAGDDPAVYSPLLCEARRRIVHKSAALREMLEGFRLHNLEHCPECGQTEIVGFDRPQMAA
jgi:hypothetical protein